MTRWVQQILLGATILLLLCQSAYADSPLPSVEPEITIHGFSTSVQVSYLPPNTVVQLWRGGANCTDGAAAHVIASRRTEDGAAGSLQSLEMVICGACCTVGVIDVCQLVNSSEGRYLFERIGSVSALEVSHTPTNHSYWRTTDVDALQFPSSADSTFFVGLTDFNGDFLPEFCMSSECSHNSNTTLNPLDANRLTYAAQILSHSLFIVDSTAGSVSPLTGFSEFSVSSPIAVSRVGDQWVATASALSAAEPSDTVWTVGDYNTYVASANETSGMCVATEGSTFSGVTGLSARVFELATISPLRSTSAVLRSLTNLVEVRVAAELDAVDQFVVLQSAAGAGCSNDPQNSPLALASGNLTFISKNGVSHVVYHTTPFQLAGQTDVESVEVSLCVGSESFRYAGSFFLLTVFPFSTTLFTSDRNSICALPPLDWLEDDDSSSSPFAFLSTVEDDESISGAFNITVGDLSSVSPQLAAPQGTYSLSYSVVNNITADVVTERSASMRHVQVFEPYVVDSPNLVYVTSPFNVSLTGGDIESAAQDVFLFLINGSEQCEASLCDGSEPPHTDILAFYYTSAVNSTVTVTVTLPTQLVHDPVRLCVQSRDLSRNTSVALYDDPLPLPVSHGMLPTSMVKGREQEVRSLQLESGRAMLSYTANCSQPIADSALISDGKSTLSIDLCEPASVVYYCEGSSTAAASADWDLPSTMMQLLSLYDCEAEKAINLVNTSFLPGTPVTNFGLTADFAYDPYLSCSNSCTTGPSAHLTRIEEEGYVPTEEQNPSYFVCVTSPDSTLNFTTDAETIVIEGFTINPSRITEANSTEESMQLYPAALAPSSSFWTRSAACSLQSPVFNATDVSNGAAGTVNFTISPGESGIYHLCSSSEGLNWPDNGCSATSGASELVPISSVLVVEPPSILNTTPLVANSMICVDLSVPNDLYSLLSDESDSAYASYAPYYNATSRGMFLTTLASSDAASDACAAASSLNSTVLVNATGSDGVFSACFNTSAYSSNSSVIVCSGTPAGFLASRMPLELQEAEVSPTMLLYGTTTLLSIPMFPNTTFVMVPEDSTDASAEAATSRSFDTASSRLSSSVCASVSSGTEFTTNADGASDLTLSAELSSGIYVLCRELSNAEWIAEFTLEVIAPSYFSVFPSTVVRAVPTTIFLGDDLNAELLVAGMFESEDCSGTALDSSLANWNASDSSLTSVVVTVADTYTTAAYMCATAPLNGSVVAVPSTGFSTIAQPLSFTGPLIGCLEFSIFYDTDSLSSTASSAVSVALSNGPCCTSDPSTLVAATADVVAEGLSVGPGFRTFLLNDTVLAAVTDDSGATVCYANDEYACIAAGTMQVSSVSYCSTNINYLRIAATADRENPKLTGFPSKIWLIITGASCFGFLLIIAALFVFCCWRREVSRTGRVTSKADPPDGERSHLSGDDNVVQPPALDGAEQPPPPQDGDSWMAILQPLALDDETARKQLHLGSKEGALVDPSPILLSLARRISSDGAGDSKEQVSSGDLLTGITRSASSGGDTSEAHQDVKADSQRTESSEVDDVSAVEEAEARHRETESEGPEPREEVSAAEEGAVTPVTSHHEAELEASEPLSVVAAAEEDGATGVTANQSRGLGAAELAGVAGGLTAVGAGGALLVNQLSDESDDEGSCNENHRDTGDNTGQLLKDERRSRRSLYRDEDHALHDLIHCAYDEWRAAITREGEALTQVLQKDDYWNRQSSQLRQVNEEAFRDVMLERKDVDSSSFTEDSEEPFPHGAVTSTMNEGSEPLHQEARKSFSVAELTRCTTSPMSVRAVLGEGLYADTPSDATPFVYGRDESGLFSRASSSPRAMQSRRHPHLLTAVQTPIKPTANPLHEDLDQLDADSSTQ